jgi:hypothetical protein
MCSLDLVIQSLKTDEWSGVLVMPFMCQFGRGINILMGTSINAPLLCQQGGSLTR